MFFGCSLATNIFMGPSYWTGIWLGVCILRWKSLFSQVLKAHFSSLLVSSFAVRKSNVLLMPISWYMRYFITLENFRMFPLSTALDGSLKFNVSVATCALQSGDLKFKSWEVFLHYFFTTFLPSALSVFIFRIFLVLDTVCTKWSPNLKSNYLSF